MAPPTTPYAEPTAPSAHLGRLDGEQHEEAGMRAPATAPSRAATKRTRPAGTAAATSQDCTGEIAADMTPALIAATNTVAHRGRPPLTAGLAADQYHDRTRVHD